MAHEHPITRLGGWAGYDVVADWQERRGEQAWCVLKLQAVPGWLRQCSHCGQSTRAVHDQQERRVRDLPIFQYRVELIVPRLRVACTRCGPKLERRAGWSPMADATASVFKAMAEDPDRETLGRLLTGWQATFGRTAAMVRDAVKQAWDLPDRHAELREVLRDIADERGEINRPKLGWWIRRHAGRIVDGLRFVRASGNRSAEAWQVESVSPDQSVFGMPITKSVGGTADGGNAYARASRGT